MGIRIALVIGQLSIGGAEGQLCSLVRRLRGSRFDPIVYSLVDNRGGVRSILQESNITLRVVGGGGLWRARALATVLRQDEVVLVHSWLFIANTYAWMASMMGARVPLVTSARNCKSQGLVHHMGNVAAFRSSRRIIVNSERVREYIARRYAAPRQRMTLVYNGVDLERFRRREPRSEPVLTVMTAGRFVAQKNPWLFFEAAKRLHRELPNVRFVMLGDGPLKGAIEERARAEGMWECLALPGERTDIESWLSRSDVFWLTSDWEGLPNVILESMACGVPVVATDVGGTRELFRNGVEGFLVKPGEAAEFSRRGEELLRDHGMRMQMGKAARERAEQFSLDRMVSDMERVYMNAVESHRGG
jgi:glycosyltransferase involved in cell wall biosynthesis